MSDKFAGGIKAGSNSVSVPIVVRRNSDNTEFTGIVAAGVTATYRRQGSASVPIAAVDLTGVTAAWSSGGWKETDATNRPGEYRLDVPDAAFASGADWVSVAVKIAGAYMFYERYALESKGSTELWNVLVPNAGTAQAGSASTLTLASTASGTAGTYIGSIITITGGTGAGQTRIVTGYNGTTRVANINRSWTTTPDNSSVYALLSADAVAPVNSTLQCSAATVAGGVMLTAAGLDQITIEPGVNARQALSPILAACAGVLGGAATSSVTIAAANNPGTNRITANVDSAGNRNAVVLNLPA